jgi:uncharacterized membrane protein YhaH (DUF805 family)
MMDEGKTSAGTTAVNEGTLHISDGGETRGPYEMGQLRSMWGQGLITAAALYWREGMEEWRPVSELDLEEIGGSVRRGTKSAPRADKLKDDGPQRGMTRPTYWWVWGGVLVLAVLAQVVPEDTSNMLWLGVLVVLLITTAERLRNIGHSGWWSCLALVPIVSLAVYAYASVAPANTPRWEQLSKTARILIATIYLLPMALIVVTVIGAMLLRE